MNVEAKSHLVRIEVPAAILVELFKGGNRGDMEQPGLSLACNALEHMAHEFRLLAYALNGDAEELSLSDVAAHCFFLAHQCETAAHIADNCDLVKGEVQP